MNMNELSAALDVCLPLMEGEMIYLDYPVYGNVGDLLIWQGANAFFKRHRKKFLGQYSINNISKRAFANIEKSSTICFHGGGNFGDLWPHHHKLREDIIQKYPHKRIIILPQSVHFDNKLELERSCDILKRHPDLHIFLRDKNSFAILEGKGLNNLKLCPDMAHALWGALSVPKPIQSSPLYLLRRDKEESDLPTEIAAEKNHAVDWDNLLRRWTRQFYNYGVRVNELDGRLNNILPALTVWHMVSNRLISRAIDLFAPHETIVTNRLHAMILSALLERKAVVFDNSYGKISSYADLWMKDVAGISFKTA